MRVCICLLAAMVIAPLAGAVDEGQWINLFDGETLFGWEDMGDVEWAVDGGAITSGKGTGGMIATTSQFQNFELTAKVRVKAGTTSGIAFRAGLDGHGTENGSSVLWLRERKNSESPWRDVHIKVVGNNYHVMLDGKMEAFEQGANSIGHIALLFHHNGGGKVGLKDVKLRPIGLDPIFDGKTLDGWSVIPGKRSKFAVIDGAISIKDGNGQIETTDTFKNFILQLDIISHGEHLNSGVFFRGPVGVFWKGYESQVRNQWTTKGREHPVDFGTGGNYGNQPARKVVSTDGEWFSKTVVCNGNHYAVWINGYQASDYLDTRPVNKNYNAKEGYVGEAGTIHLQGHDPTTDLSFKNINVQQYPN